MLDRGRYWLGLAGVGLALVVGLSVWRDVQGHKMSELKIELGQNIVETARKSGVSNFDARRVASTVSYSVNNLPQNLPVRYVKSGYEVSWQPVFAVAMYADGATMKVDAVSLQLQDTKMSDAEAQAFAEATIAQFQRGKWQRYGDPQEDVLLTGRSSYLDEQGHFQELPMSVDPNFKIPPKDWLVLTVKGVRWRWVGDGVLAKLSVDNSPGEDGKPAYRMDLEFDLLDVKRQRDVANLARELQQGDAKGWNSTAEHATNKKLSGERLRRIEEAAIKRGDSVVPAPSY